VAAGAATRHHIYLLSNAAMLWFGVLAGAAMRHHLSRLSHVSMVWFGVTAGAATRHHLLRLCHVSMLWLGVAARAATSHHYLISPKCQQFGLVWQLEQPQGTTFLSLSQVSMVWCGSQSSHEAPHISFLPRINGCVLCGSWGSQKHDLPCLSQVSMVLFDNSSHESVT
jgi:hypothetical protein